MSRKTNRRKANKSSLNKNSDVNSNDSSNQDDKIEETLFPSEETLYPSKVEIIDTPSSIFDEVVLLLDKLSHQELRDINEIAYHKIQIKSKQKNLEKISKFNIGEKVSFDNDNRVIIGTIISLNQKSISVMTEDNHRWRVSPNLLHKVI